LTAHGSSFARVVTSEAVDGNFGVQLIVKMVKWLSLLRAFMQPSQVGLRVEYSNRTKKTNRGEGLQAPNYANRLHEVANGNGIGGHE
jgi:hypothetical protein